MKKSFRILVICIFFLPVILDAQEGNKRSLSEQSDFGAEDESWQRPVPVPDDVLRTVREIRHASAEELPANWLLASEIHLNAHDETNLIVMGVGGLRLPHAALFWVFRKTPKSYELILSTGGDALTVLKARSNGYRKIRVYNNTASSTTGAIYRFNGQQYIQSQTQTQSIK